MNEFSKNHLFIDETLREGIEEYKIKPLLVRHFDWARALRVELLYYGKSRKNGQHKILHI